MRRRLSTVGRGLLLVPLGLALQAQRAPQSCPAASPDGAYIEPVLLLATESGLSVQVVNGNIITEEVMQIAREGWMLRDELRIAEEGLAFPAGTAIARSYISREPRCLPHAPAVGRAEPPRVRIRGGRLACLVDADGDGRFEQVRMYRTNYAMHVPQERLDRTFTLAAPIALAPDPLGAIGSRRRVTRRLAIGTVDGDRVRFILSHRFRDVDQREGGSWDEAPGGGHVYRPLPPPPVPILWGGHNPSANSLAGELVRLVEGETITVAGIRMVVEADSPSFPDMLSLRPTTWRFPRWLHLACDGRAVRTGAEGDPVQR